MTLTGRKFLFPVKVMGALLRGKMMAALRELHARGRFAGFDDFDDPEAFDHLMRKLAWHDWVVYAKKPFKRVDHVLQYLGRYTHRVGIANSRILDVKSDAVTFRTKHGQSVTLAPVEFLRRFVQHVLPDGFHKIRHYGLYAGAAGEALKRARDLFAPPPAPPLDAIADEPYSWVVELRELTGRDIRSCPHCGGVMEPHPVEAPRSRAPPTIGADG